MPATLQQMRREGGAAGKPGAAGLPGQIALNFSQGATASELWAYSQSVGDWVRLNPPGVSPTVRGVQADNAGASIEAAFQAQAVGGHTVAAGEIIVYTWPQGPAGQPYIFTGGKGVWNGVTNTPTAGMFTSLGGGTVWATAADLIAGTNAAAAVAPDKLRAELIRLFGNAGAAYATGAAPLAVATSAGAADAGKLVKLDAAGRLPSNMMPTAIPDFTGGADITSTAPGGAKAGDMFIVGTGGAPDGSWTGLPNPTAAGTVLMFDGTNYTPIASDYLLLAGGAMTGDATITFASATPANVIIDGTTAANAVIDNVTLDGGAY